MIATLGRVLNLLDSGLSIIPIGDKKIPWIKWKQYQTALISKEDLKKYAEDSRTKGFGICTGFEGLECFDIDLKVLPTLKEQKDFWDEYIKMLRDHIDDFDRKFVIYKTVNSGYHIIYKCAEVEGNKKIATLKGQDRAIIETRGNGGYIFVYDNQFSKLSYNQIQEISIEDRSILFGISKYFDYNDNIEKIEVTDHNEGLTPWDDYNNRNTVFDVFNTDFKIVRKLRDKIVIKREGAESAHSGYVYNESGLMYLFTTATCYPSEKGLSPFSVYAWKYHNGDYKKASIEIYNQGYGERKQIKKSFEKPKNYDKNIQFPIDIFPENIQTYLIESSKSLNTSIDYMGSSLMWVLSLIVGNSCKMQVKPGWRESVNIWIALVGRAGIGKTPSINHIINPLKRKNSFEIKNYQKEYAKFIEYKNLNSDEKKYAEPIKEPVRKQFIVNDVTTEALIALHEDNQNSIGLYKDELNGWIKDMNKYRTGSDLQFWLSVFSNEMMGTTRKTAQSNHIDSPVIPVLGGIQPGIFSQVSTEENKDNGFLDRLLLSYPEMNASYYNRKNLNPELIDWYENYIMNLYDVVKNKVIQYNINQEIEPWICQWNKEADTEWERIHNKIIDMINSDNENEFVKSMLSKQISYIPRFALLLNALYSYDSDDTNYQITEVRKEAVLSAEKLSDYFILMAKKIKFDTLEKKELKELLIEIKDLPLNEKIIQIFNSFPEAKKTDIAEMLNTSRQTIHRVLNKK
jgi:hypothetical protein